MRELLVYDVPPERSTWNATLTGTSLGLATMMIAVLAMLALAMVGGLVQSAPSSRTNVERPIVAACNSTNGSMVTGSCAVSK